MSNEMLLHVSVAVLTAAAILMLISVRDAVARWAYVVGMVSHGFWVVATIQAEQWGMLMLVGVYSWIWCNGIWTHWIKPWLIFRRRAHAWR